MGCFNWFIHEFVSTFQNYIDFAQTCRSRVLGSSYLLLRNLFGEGVKTCSFLCVWNIWIWTCKLLSSLGCFAICRLLRILKELISLTQIRRGEIWDFSNFEFLFNYCLKFRYLWGFKDVFYTFGLKNKFNLFNFRSLAYFNTENFLQKWHVII